MSYCRATYDPCAYQYDLGQSLMVGRYYLDTPAIASPCFYDDPRIRLQAQGVSTCHTRDIVSLDSEMMGITRRYSKCPNELFPSHEFKCKTVDLPSCSSGGYWTEDTRLSNPPCTLRGTGNNRWEWLPCNPQDKALIPFQTNVNSSIVVKDNHRPLLPTPLPQDDVISDTSEYNWTDRWMSGRQQQYLPYTSWRTCDEIVKM